jgi:hypothetical protein
MMIPFQMEYKSLNEIKLKLLQTPMYTRRLYCHHYNKVNFLPFIDHYGLEFVCYGPYEGALRRP